VIRNVPASGPCGLIATIGAGSSRKTRSSTGPKMNLSLVGTLSAI
jgi:hypothetical protein